MSWRFSGPVWARSCCCGSTAAAASRCGPSWRRACARQSGAAGCRAASGCRRPGNWPGSWASPAAWCRSVYSQLLSEGYLTSQIGSATRVAAGAYPAPAQPPPRPAPPPRLIADFRSGVPDLASFPRGDWVWATREACGSVANLDLDYGDPRGSAVLRGVLAGYLRRVRAAAAEPGADDREHRVRAGTQPGAAGARPGWRAGAPPSRTPATGAPTIERDRAGGRGDRLARGPRARG